jgi:hypothetical protein
MDCPCQHPAGADAGSTGEMGTTKEQGMIRKLKVLGLALVAVLAFSAVAASASQAFEFTSFNTVTEEHEGGTSVGNQTEGNKHKFTPTGGFSSIQCTVAHFTGTSATGTEAAPTTHPEYSGCTDSLGRAVDVSTAGCNYVFHVTKGSGDEFEGTTDIECEAGKAIVVSITNGSKEVVCTDTVGAQNGTGPVVFKNMTESSPTDITVESKATNVVNTVKNGPGFFPCGAADGTYKNGTYTGNTTVQAFNNEGEPIDLTVM